MEFLCLGAVLIFCFPVILPILGFIASIILAVVLFFVSLILFSGMAAVVLYFLGFLGG